MLNCINTERLCKLYCKNHSAMVAVMGFISNSTGQSILWSRKATKCSFCAVPVDKSCKKAPQMTYMRRAIKRKPLHLFVVSPRDSNANTSSLSPAQTIMLFYSAINEKNLKQLDMLIAEDCFFEDHSFPKPFEGKKEVLHFLEQLTLSMGQNMQFNVEHICEGNDYTAAVNWHLDWKKIQVPFTRGCSNYSLSISRDKLVITEAQVLVESPVKLGVIALTIFKFISTLFDAFPSATEWFLKSPHIVLRLILKAIRPIISPFLAWYIKVLNFATYIVSFTLKILYYLAKIFHV